MPIMISQEIKDKARKLVMNGTNRKDAAMILGVRPANVYAWTRDIRLPMTKTTSKQEYIMGRLAGQGYFVAKKQGDLSTLRLLKERQGIRISNIRGLRIAFVKGREMDALKAFLREKKIHFISSHKLSQIEHAFGLKDTEKVKKELKNNDVKLTDFL
jgi:hypothetical protein